MFKIQKISFIYFLVTIFCIFLLSNLLSNNIKAVVNVGGLIKISEEETVYLLENDGKRYVIYYSSTSGGEYWSAVLESHGYSMNDVNTVTVQELTSYPIGGNMTIKAGGDYLIRKECCYNSYKVIEDNKIQEVDPETTGNPWGSNAIIVPDAFFLNYEIVTKPDLDIIDIEYYAPNVIVPKIGDYIGYKVTVKNIGMVEVRGPFIFKAFINGSYLRYEGYSEDYTVAPGGTFVNKQYSYTTFSKIGSNEIKVIVDYDNNIDESNENNNTLTKIITIVDEKPDLIITDVSYSVNDFILDDTKSSIRFTVKYENNSNVDINNNFSVCTETGPTAEYLNGYKDCWMMNLLTSNIAEIKANTEYTFPQTIGGYLIPKVNSLNKIFTFYIDRDLYNIADRDNVIDESNEDNNTFTKIITIVDGKPDLLMENLGLSPLNPTINQEVIITAQGRYNGSVNLIESKGILNYYYNFPDFIQTKILMIPNINPDNPLLPYKPIMYQFKGYFTSSGNKNLTFNIDNTNELDEVNENNNSKSREILVTSLSDRPDLAITEIKFDSPNNIKNEDGTVFVTVKNLGGNLTSGQGLLNWYNNLSSQNFIFNSKTPSILSFQTDRNIPTETDPLKTNESIIFSWIGNFNTSGNLYIHFTVDNANELVESNEKNNTLTTIFKIKESLYEELPQVEDEQVIEINYRAELLHQDKLDQILTELQELRDIVKEQETQIKYLTDLMKDVQELSEQAQNAINNFITYGVDTNTKWLGAGERAAVIHSFKSAFKKLPETEAELADVIKIANGRWPSMRSEEAEDQANEQFEKIYLKTANMDNPSDNAAITVMAYGLRQKAENRNLDSEKAGIKIFQDIYGYHPDTTEDWNIMQAITYSGSSRGIDTDGDLLLDERELELGTDPNNPDSDGDGYLDGMEVANGYNPLGEGKM